MNRPIGQLIHLPPLRRLSRSEELESTAIELEAKRWEAVEWAREHGVRLLRDPDDEPLQGWHRDDQA